MILEINFESEEPIYLQLRNRIIEGIAQNKICPGENLPSVRVMAANLDINLHTVNKSYNLLKNDGFIVIHKRKGVLINSYENMKDDRFSDRFEESIKPLIAEAICKGLDKEEILQLFNNVYSTMKGEQICSK